MKSLLLRLLLLFVLFTPVSSQEMFIHRLFTQAEGTVLLGDAKPLSPDGLRLTPAQEGRKGGVWHRERVNVAERFVTSFWFKISGLGGHKDLSGYDGGEGFAFVIQNSDSVALGGAGATLGYHGIPNSIAIEFDLWNNGAYNGDPNHNHISVHTRGRAPNDFNHRYSIASATSVADMSAHKLHKVVVDYIPGRLAIYLDDCSKPALTVPIRLDTLLDLERGTAWLGFTAATASAWQNHDIFNWAFLKPGFVQGDSIVLCKGDSVVVEVPGGYIVKQWSTGATGRRIVVRDSGSYAVLLGAAYGCEERMETWRVHVRVVDIPKADIVVDGSSILCEGGTVRLRSRTKALRYLWSTGDTTESILAVRPGEYRLVVMGEGGCTDTAVVPIKAAKAPEAPRLPSKTTLCPGDSVVLDAGPEYAAYLWSTGEETRSIVVSTPGTYWVKVKGENGCMVVSDTIHVSSFVTNAPRLNITEAAVICSGDSMELDAGGLFARYLWSTGDTSHSIVVPGTGAYWVRVWGETGCEAVSDTAVITVSPLPEPSVAATRWRLCGGDTARLEASEGFEEYVWSTGERARTIDVVRPGVYSVQVTDGNGCRGIRSVEIAASEPVLPVIVPAGPTRLCRGDSVTLTAPEGFERYLWSTNEEGRSIVVRKDGEYRVTVVDSVGCEWLSAPVVVEAAPLVSVDAGPDLVICEGGSAVLTAVVPADLRDPIYLWSPAEGLSCTDCRIPVARPARTTRYTVTVTTPDGCRAGDEVVVTVDPGSGVLRARIPIDLNVHPGSEVLVPVLLDDDPDAALVSDLTINVRFDPRIMRFHALETAGTLVDDGWSLTSFPDPNSDRSIFVRFKAPSGDHLRGTGALVRLRFGAFLGGISACDLPLAIILPDRPCLVPEEQPGRIRLDSLCGINLRLIEAGNVDVALDPNRPDPFNPVTEISFSTGLEGAVRLEIFDALGRSVSVLVDETLAAGRHSVTWDGGNYPSGIYYYRLTSGTWSGTGTMALVK